ncbi:NPC intracellular cholesterol transporter 2-like [Anticarsia gemmatalis]|uniref:NPC intracellular cholesterol transporter 2-like n=1 Tax=Anticarsia gemmatalis TaxID=129554 RepID=UPI003F76F870
MLRLVVLLCAFAALVKGQSTPVSQCTAYPGVVPINAYIEGCDNPPCQFPRGSDAVIHMIFRAPYNIRRMRTLASAQMIGMIPYPLEENAETCNFLTNGFCPVMSGEVLSYTLKMHIETAFPLITVNIEFRIVDDNNLSFVCLRVPVRIVRAVTNLQGALNGTLTDL